MAIPQVSPSMSSSSLHFISQKLSSSYTILAMVTLVVIIKIAIDHFRSSSKTIGGDLKKRDLICKTFPEQTKAQQLFYQRLNHFSATMYTNLQSVKQGKNFIFFTPNLLMILSMIYAEGPNELKQSFAQEFGIDANFTEQMFYDEQDAYSHDLGNRSGVKEEKNTLYSLFTTQPSTQLVYQTSNAALIRKDAAPNVENIRHQFEVMRFENSQDAEAKANEWVGQKTQGKIIDLVKNLNPEVVFILVTTSFFAGKWVHTPLKKRGHRRLIFITRMEQLFLSIQCAMQQMIFVMAILHATKSTLIFWNFPSMEMWHS